jgi:hypothetical protein
MLIGLRITINDIGTKSERGKRHSASEKRLQKH